MWILNQDENEMISVSQIEMISIVDTFDIGLLSKAENENIIIARYHSAGDAWAALHNLVEWLNGEWDIKVFKMSEDWDAGKRY